MNQELTIQKPRICGISAVAENILLLSIQDGMVKGGVQIPYVEEPGETLEIDRNIPALVYIVRDGQRIGVKVEDRQKGTQRFPYEYRVGEKLDTAAADDTASYLVNGKKPIAVYRKTKPNNIVDPINEYTYLHRIYLVCEDMLVPGEEIMISIKTGVFEQGEMAVSFKPEILMCEAIHVNQVGYRKDDPSKKAYLSQWMGLGGGIRYDHIKTFSVIDENGSNVFEGQIKLNHTGEIEPMGEEEISALAPVYELDFSSFDREGTYRIMVPQLGCSFPFHVGETATWESGFRASMNAIYCQRSGTVTGKPYTDFERPRVYHPDDGRIVYQSTCSLFASGNGLNCYGTDVNNFGNLIRGATEEVVENAWGGYFDACDWDRRIQHLRASRLHTELYLMFPDYFDKLRLSIPESGNGVADILNEACWNIDFYKRLQLPNGGIRGGIEAEEHPILGQCGWQDTWKAYAYAPDFWSSYFYASAAARMAYALRKTDEALSDEYRVSAEKAFAYAERTFAECKAAEGHKWTRRAHSGVIYERENAACDLFRLTQKPEYEKIYLSVRTGKNPDANFTYASLPEGIGDKAVKELCLQWVLDTAQKALDNGARLPFHMTTENVETDRGNGFGAFSAIPRNTQLIRAHFLTGDSKYLAAAIASADFAAGANPDNMSMTTGVGIRYPQNTLHHDSRMTGQEAPVGITVFGTQAFNFPDDAFPRLLQADFLWPGAYVWPTFEGYLDIYRHPCVTEYTVQGTLGPNAYQWGYFAARAAL